MHTISLFELNSLIKHALSANLATSYWVIAEISELRTAQKGHCYLELVEKEGNYIQAKLRATIWSFTFRKISSAFENTTGTPLKPGMKILANISIDYHELYGLSANIKDIDPNFTLGERARKKQEILSRLMEEDLLDKNKSHELPLVPQRIAVISSKTAAGYGDFLQQLLHNDYRYRFKITLYNSLMQGCDSATSIIKSLETIRRKISNYDLIVIVRGGGAQTDLECFDDYDLARQIALFPIPVITGIGHERDETIADLVAHTKLKTPTAVAAFLISGMNEYEYRLNSAGKNIHQIAGNYCAEQRHKLSDHTKFLKHQKKRSWESQEVLLVQFQQRLKRNANQLLKNKSEQLNLLTRQLKSFSRESLQRETVKISYIQRTLRLSDPIEILKKGYTLSYIDGKPLNEDNVKEGAIMLTRSSNLTVESQIIKQSSKKTRNEKF